MMAEAAATDWIEWNGGECPLPRRVEVRYRGGYEQMRAVENSLDNTDWLHLPSDPEGDIIAYRVVSA